MEINITLDGSMKCGCGGYIIPVYRSFHRKGDGERQGVLAWACTKCDIRVPEN